MSYSLCTEPTLCEPKCRLFSPTATDARREVWVDKESLAVQGHSPLMELPPLSPGIQARVMEEVEVVETVRRGWSGGTAEETPRVNTSIIPLCKHYGIFKGAIVSLLCVPFLPVSYLALKGWLWWCRNPVCWWPCRCSNQNPQLWQSAAPASHWTEWVAVRLEILGWLYPH